MLLLLLQLYPDCSNCQLKSLVIIVTIVVAIELKLVTCGCIISFLVTLPSTQDSLVGISLGRNHWIENSCLESCGIERVHFQDLIDVS